MASPRWRKLRGDLRATWGRLVTMQLVIALALAAVGTALGARAVLGREIRASYAATHPADVTFELDRDVDDALLAAVRAQPQVAEVDRREMVRARVRLAPGDPWQMLVLFVADDFTALRLQTFEPDGGAWPPPRGAILVERTAVPVMGLGGTSHAAPHGPHGHAAMMATLFAPRVTVQTPHGTPTEVAVAGTVHDAGQAPNWQEHRGCAYATRETLALLGERPELHDLLVTFRAGTELQSSALALASWLRAQGHAVHEVRIPPWHQHPHQALMDAVQTVLLGFALMLLVLSSIVVATLLATILARQMRDIGVMKAIGATTGQIAALYGVVVVVLGAVAAAIALPLAHVAAHGMIGATSYMMNITVADPAIPAWVYLATAGLGLVTPLLVAAVPILRAARLTVRAALAGSGSAYVRPGLTRLPIPIRNALRRPARLALVMALLVAGGALVIAGANLDRSLRTISSRLADARHYDVEVRLHVPASDDVVRELSALAGVRALEPWSAADAARGDVVHTYPDGGHGSFTLAAPPAAGTSLVGFPLLAGRWLAPGDDDAVVLGNNAAGATRVGDRIALGVDGSTTTWTVVGIVEEMAGSSGFVSQAGYARAVAHPGPTLLRFATTARDAAERAAIVAQIEALLAERNIAVRYALPSPLLRSIIDDHVALVVRAVIVMALVIALVGLFGLAAATAIQVAERTRELGILKTLGASDRRILRIVLGEAVAVGAASAVLAVVLSFPVSLAATALLGSNGLLANPALDVAPVALVGWPVVLVLGSAIAAWLPARRAARLTVRAALAEI